MALKEGRSKAKWNFFRDKEMEFQFMRSMAVISEGGAEIGECLKVKTEAKDGDTNSLSEAWSKLAFYVESDGVRQQESSNVCSACSSFLRASNYYRSAMTCLSPLNKMHFENWKKAKECFEKAGSLSKNPFEYIPIPFKEGYLPCYLLQPSDMENKRPTLIVVTGGEGTAMEMYFWCAGEGLRRGYNILLCELPGNISTLYLCPSLTLRPDTEAPMKNVLDYLETRDTIDSDRIAIIGYSAGGYFASRAAAFENRIKALIANSPLRDMHGMFTSVFPKVLLSPSSSSLLNYIIKHFVHNSTKTSVELVLWESGIERFSDFVELTKEASLIGIEKNITCPTLALSGEGEGNAFLEQAKLFFENISSIKKELKVFSVKDGASAHCQIDNLTIARNTFYDWLDTIFQ